MKRLLAAILVCSAAGVMADATPAKYQTSCFACHATGAAGAPLAHDAAVWQPRMAQGMPTLLLHVKNGFNAMPPKGMCVDCTDADYTALIEFMAAPASAK